MDRPKPSSYKFILQIVLYTNQTNPAQSKVLGPCPLCSYNLLRCKRANFIIFSLNSFSFISALIPPNYNKNYKIEQLNFK